MFEVTASASRNAFRQPTLRVRASLASGFRGGFGGRTASHASAKRRLVLRWVYTLLGLAPHALIALPGLPVALSASMNVEIHLGPGMSSVMSSSSLPE